MEYEGDLGPEDAGHSDELPSRALPGELPGLLSQPLVGGEPGGKLGLLPAPGTPAPPPCLLSPPQGERGVLAPSLGWFLCLTLPELWSPRASEPLSSSVTASAPSSGEGVSSAAVTLRASGSGPSVAPEPEAGARCHQSSAFVVLGCQMQVETGAFSSNNEFLWDCKIICIYRSGVVTIRKKI